MDDSTRTASEVVLSVPLQAEYASAVRVLVSSIAADLDFTIDELDDLRLGVSELFTILSDDDADGTVADARCETVIAVDDGEISVTMAREPAAPLELDGLASTILISVVDAHEVGHGSVTIRKRAAEARS